MNKLEYENEAMYLYCDEAYLYVFVQFKITPSFPQYVTSMQKAIDVLSEKKMNYLIADVKKWDVGFCADNGPSDKFLLQRLIEYRVKKFVIITGCDFEMYHYTHTQIVFSQLLQIKVRHCNSFKEAENWILLLD